MSRQLESKSDLPVFLVTGSPLAPIPADEINFASRASTSDGLRAYPEFVALIMNAMLALKRPLILLSGDPHFSSMCEFTIEDDVSERRLECISIISSGVNVPLPFANDRVDTYDWNPSPPAFIPHGATFRLKIKCSTVLSNRRAHVLRLGLARESASRWQLEVAAIEADGSESPPPIVKYLHL